MYRHVKMSAIESDLHFQDPKLAFLLGIKFLVTKSQFTIIAYTTSWLQFGTLTIEMSLVYHNYVYGKYISLFHPDFIVKILHILHLDMFSIHFPRSWQGEFVKQSGASLAGDHFLYSHDLNV